jgi:hypothetical protein
MMEILPFLTSPMGCDLPMSLVLSCSPSLVSKTDIQKLGGVFTDEEIVDDY